jgi:hypothetical protein
MKEKIRNYEGKISKLKESKKEYKQVNKDLFI